jgi:predicted DNA-binding protein (MmcQ/YjbR family)
MITGETFTKMALSLPGTEQAAHFERTGFKVTGKRMFATYLEKDNTANIFLTPVEQSVFCQADAGNIYPVPNKWGLKGATTFNLDKVAKELVMEALLSAYNEVMKPKKGGSAA